MDLDSLWMVYWEDCRNDETGSRAGVSDWRSVLCCVALLSRLPEFPDTDSLNCFRDVGKNCVLDVNARGTYNCVRPPRCGLETLLICRLFRIAGWRRCLLLWSCKCAVVRRCAVAREMEIPSGVYGAYSSRLCLLRIRHGLCWLGFGTCTTCGKHIQQNLGKHIALYHMELA